MQRDTTHGANHSEPVHTLANGFEHEWLDVEQAVALALELGLSRTPKTIRKWAERSSGLPDGDVVARRDDTPWGYRWLIEKASLTRKVEEELELRGGNHPEPVRTGSDEVRSDDPQNIAANWNEPTLNHTEQVHTGSDAFGQPISESDEENRPEPGSHRFAPVQAGAETETVLDVVRERMADKDREIAFLREQLAAAQAEVGKRAASTDEALKSLDRVVRSFELQAEANRTLALGAEQRRTDVREATEPFQFTPTSVDSGVRHHDVRRV